jgi:predicted helicase
MADAMLTYHRAKLKEITSFASLVSYLRDEMGWPVDGDDLDPISFDYTAEELGIEAASAAKIQEIKRLRPLSVGQPWGIFLVRFEPKRLPVVALRRILSRVVLKKRASANSADSAAWQAEDLLFVSNFGEGDERQICFAHFSLDKQKIDLPTLKVLGWDNLDTPLRLDHVADTLTERLAWPDDERDVEAWRGKWRSAFTERHREVITTSKLLAERLAELARAIRSRINTVLAIETEDGPVTKLMKAFREALVHDLDADGFADMYAQTIAYGLLSARIADPRADTADDFAAHMRTNPFLKELMETFLHVGGRRKTGNGIELDFDELGISEVVALLDAANMEAVLRDFGDRNPQDDPVIHFYELFLKEYDAKKRMQRGVFYTPRPVVSYIVRSVHELLQTEFGLADGLADTATWGDMAERHPGLTLPEGVKPTDRFVTVLDPATGTGTFLVEAIDVIHRTLVDRWRREGHSGKKILDLWNDYVPKHLLPRLHGYELMMAPYAIAHVKIGLKLHETGYRFGSEERARIYLTNALEPAFSTGQQTLTGILPALAHEAQAVNGIKQRQRFTIVIGNPPYSGTSANTGRWIKDLVRDYYQVDGADLGERNPKWLQDDYVKFIRLAQFLLCLSPLAVFGFITNHGYVDNPTFRGMRQSLLTSFRRLWVLDLHGNVKKKEKGSDADDDENVFDIQQGVAVILAARARNGSSDLKQSDIFGSRIAKYEVLTRNSVNTLSWQTVSPASPFYLYVLQDEHIRAEWLRWPSLKQAMPVNVLGFQTHRDHFAIAFERAGILSRCDDLRDNRVTDADLTATYGLKDNRDWNVQGARREICNDAEWEGLIIRCLYRPFDTRWCYFSTVAMDYPRRDLLDHVARKSNLCLLVPRQISFLPWRHASVSDVVAESCLVSTKTKEQNYSFPLYLYPKDAGLSLVAGRRANFAERFLRDVATALGLVQRGDRIPPEVSPEAIFHYIYGILHSPGYRRRYEDFLKSDFPRAPLPSKLDLFRQVVRLGGELVMLHLLKSPKLDRPITIFTGPRNPEVGRVGWSDETVWLDEAATKRGQPAKSGTIGFRGVPEEVWNFHIGGYQVCEKWLKDRKGRTLTAEDITHYHRIVIALHETIRIMREIDEVIDGHGGWPGAFQPAGAASSEMTEVPPEQPELVSAHPPRERSH